jgi:hypothetical protein
MGGESSFELGTEDAARKGKNERTALLRAETAPSRG